MLLFRILRAACNNSFNDVDELKDEMHNFGFHPLSMGLEDGNKVV